jgi:hypothetical protein
LPCHSAKCTPDAVAVQPHAHTAGHIRKRQMRLRMQTPLESLRNSSPPFLLPFNSPTPFFLLFLSSPLSPLPTPSHPLPRRRFLRLHVGALLQHLWRQAISPAKQVYQALTSRPPRTTASDIGRHRLDRADANQRRDTPSLMPARDRSPHPPHVPVGLLRPGAAGCPDTPGHRVLILAHRRPKPHPRESPQPLPRH